TPDTVVTLATTAKVVVAESPDEVADAVRAWRVDVLSEAMRNRRGGREQDGRDASVDAEQGARAWRAERVGTVERLAGRPRGVEGSRRSADERGQ
ncbi:MAG TPA: flagellar FlbD family protein, partial [Solirubrobacteraceae bacterium]|nr:flagellar FlbD family protein [Solirubrobacteraceae bacterium]